ncbi:FAD-binding dehydrogenase [Pseudonocardia phyllosphaerae]|uniref:FAD-binding dehydrogenase n=1 Tax=Pseudonocardia phyllosphaerae TaxID=3390502 RepID=UPI003979D506
MDADVIVVGAGLAGLVATAELADAGKRVLVLDQTSEQNLGGQAFWSLGGLFLVGTPEQRRTGIHDSEELALSDWLGTAGFDRGADDPAGPDFWARQWATAYVHFASGEKRAWLHGQGVRWLPVVGWAERGGHLADGPGNSVPRFHLTWGTGPGVLEPFLRRVAAHADAGRVTFGFRHRVDALVTSGGTVQGVEGAVLAADRATRGAPPADRDVIGEFTFRAPAVLVTSGGIGGDHDLVRANWPDRLGTPPAHMITGVPDYVDGRMLAITAAAGGRIVNPDRMWHYTEGVADHSPVWPAHGIRIIPGPSSLWLDATGQRLPAPNFPGFDTLGTLAALRATGHDHSWFVLTRAIAEKEIALSGSEQNPDVTGKDLRATLGRVRPGMPGPVQAFLDSGSDFVVADDLDTLVGRMNDLTGGAPEIDAAEVRRQVLARDRQLANPFAKDLQVVSIHNARRTLGEKLARTAPPHALLDPAAGPLIAIRLHVLTRKTLGGLQTDLSGRVLDDSGAPVPGLWAAGEVAGFGGGGVHGYRSLEGTFLGGCLFSGRQAGRGIALTLRD